MSLIAKSFADGTLLLSAMDLFVRADGETFYSILQEDGSRLYADGDDWKRTWGAVGLRLAAEAMGAPRSPARASDSRD